MNVCERVWGGGSSNDLKEIQYDMAVAGWHVLSARKPCTRPRRLTPPNAFDSAQKRLYF